MLTLIKRELESMTVLLILPLLIMVGVIVTVVFETSYSYSRVMPLHIPRCMILSILYPLGLLPFFFTGVAASLNQSNRNKKVSTFLVTLATTRNRIVLSRFLAGGIVIAILLCPLFFTDVILLQVYPRMIPIPASYLVMMFVITFLANFVGYIMGLLLDENSGKITAIVGPFILVAVMLEAVIIKGFEGEAGLILGLLAAAGMLRIWQKFISAPL